MPYCLALFGWLHFLVSCVVLFPLFLLALSPTSLADGSNAIYLGCYSDRADVQKRALPHLQEISQEMTVDKCLEKCASLGFKYAGLEYKHECYCSLNPPRYPDKLQESQCSTPCGGGSGSGRTNGYCGGALSLSVYEQSDVKRPTFDQHRPLLCLVMIIKNEAHTIVNTLRAVKDYIDCWQILDTGSTDGTQQVIAKYFADNPSNLPGPLQGKTVPGKLFEEPFVDYGATRSDNRERNIETGRRYGRNKQNVEI